MDPYIAGIDSCFNAGPSHYSATKSEIDLTDFNNVRFEWNQCTDGGLFKIYIWEDAGGLPGDDIFSELQLTDNSAGWNHSIISISGIPNSGDLWVGIREYTATQAIGIDTDNDENGIMFATSGGHTYHGAWIGGVRDSTAADSSGNLLFKTKSSGNATTTSNLTTKMFIKHDGKVGIGTTSPAYKLHTVGDIKVESGAIGVNVNPSATDGRIDAGNDVVAYSSSDIRFKKNITPIQDALFKVQQIQGIEFDWIPNEEQHGYDGHDVGVIAQEVVEVLPEVVQIRESGYMAVKYEKMIPLLVEGIKEQQKQIDELKDKVRELEDA